jgi:hypothetical protein
MRDFTVHVLLEFPAMNFPYRVRVSPRELIFLDLRAERRTNADGTVHYRMPREAVGGENIACVRAYSEAVV